MTLVRFIWLLQLLWVYSAVALLAFIALYTCMISLDFNLSEIGDILNNTGQAWLTLKLQLTIIIIAEWRMVLRLL